MGWDFGYSWTKRQQMIDDIEAGFSKSGLTILDKASGKAGRVQYWSVKSDKGESFVLVYLCQHDRGDGIWGYKSMDEGMGPTVADCPMRLIGITKGFDNESSKNWRQRVTEHNAWKERDYSEGEKVSVYGKPYTVVGYKGRTYRIKSAKDGKIYRCAAEKMRPALPQAEVRSETYT